MVKGFLAALKNTDSQESLNLQKMFYQKYCWWRRTTERPLGVFNNFLHLKDRNSREGVQTTKIGSIMNLEAITPYELAIHITSFILSLCLQYMHLRGSFKGISSSNILFSFRGLDQWFMVVQFLATLVFKSITEYWITQKHFKETILKGYVHWNLSNFELNL